MKRLLPLALVLLLLGAAGPSSSQEKKKDEKKIDPRIAVVLPLGAPSGKTTKLTIRGIKLEDAKEVKVLEGNGTTKIVSKGKANVPDKNPDQVGDTQVVVEATLAEKITVGQVQLVVVTGAGETKPHALLVESALPVVADKEPNEGFRQSQEIKLPVVVEGTIGNPRDVDVFRFEGKKGQKVSAEVLAARHGSPLDAILTLYSVSAQQLANADDIKGSVDAKLEITLPADGVYYLTLIDAHDSGSSLHAYRLVVK